MKKITALALIIAALASNASAHHMAQSDTAGIHIIEWSPHLLMEF